MELERSLLGGTGFYSIGFDRISILFDVLGELKEPF